METREFCPLRYVRGNKHARNKCSPSLWGWEGGNGGEKSTGGERRGREVENSRGWEPGEIIRNTAR